MSSGGRSLPPLSVSLQGDGSSFEDMMDRSSNSITAFEATARSAFLQFDESIVHAASIMDNVSAETQRHMEDVAIMQSTQSRHSANELAQAYYELASTGREVESVIATMPAADRFATAGRLSLAQATNMAAAAQTALGLRSDDAAEDAKNFTHVTDVLAKTANIAQGSVQDFANALTSRAAGALKVANKSIEEGSAVLAVYASKGITSYKGGWLLNTMLRELGQAAIRKADAWKAMGLELYKSDGSMKHLADIVEMFEQKTRGMTDEVRVATLNQLGFNGELLNSINPLLGASQAIKNFEKQLEKADGTVEQVHAKQMTAFVAQLDILKNNITAVKLEIERALAPSMAKMNQILIDGIRYWHSLSDETQLWAAWGVRVAASAAAIAAALVSMGVQIAFIAFAVQQTWPFMRLGLIAIRAAAATALLPMLPYLAVVGAIAAVVAGIAYYIIGPEGIAAGWERSKEYLVAFQSGVAGFFANFAENVRLLYGWFVENWRNMFQDAGDIVLRFLGAMAKNYWVNIETQVRLITAFIGWVTAVVPKLWQYVMSTQFRLAVLEGIAFVMESYLTWFAKLIIAFGTFGKTIFKILTTIAVEVGKVMVTVALESAKMLADIAAGKIPTIADLATAAAIAGVNSVNAIAKAAAPMVEKLSQEFRDEAEMLKGDFEAGASDINFLNTATDIVKEQAGKLTTGLEDFQARTSALPELNFNVEPPQPPELPEAPEPPEPPTVPPIDQDELDKIQDKKDELAEPIVIRVSTQFDALERGTAAEYDFLANYAATVGQVYTGQNAEAADIAKGPTTTFSYSGADSSNNDKLLSEIARNTKPPKNLIEISNADLAAAGGTV